MQVLHVNSSVFISVSLAWEQAGGLEPWKLGRDSQSGSWKWPRDLK